MNPLDYVRKTPYELYIDGKYVPAENENEESLALAVKFVTSTARYEETENKEE